LIIKHGLLLSLRSHANHPQIVAHELLLKVQPPEEISIDDIAELLDEVGAGESLNRDPGSSPLPLKSMCADTPIF
jgi:hypothetical protein